MTMPNSATPRLCTPADPTAVLPTEAEVADAIEDAYSGWVDRVEAGEDVTDTEYEAMARAALALLAAQPTVAQIQAEALREAAVGLWGDDSAERGTTKALHHSIYATWLQARADRIESEG